MQIRSNRQAIEIRQMGGVCSEGIIGEMVVLCDGLAVRRGSSDLSNDFPKTSVSSSIAMTFGFEMCEPFRSKGKKNTRACTRQQAKKGQPRKADLLKLVEAAESNPRPQALCLWFYMLSFAFNFALLFPAKRGAGKLVHFVEPSGHAQSRWRSHFQLCPCQSVWVPLAQTGISFLGCCR